MLKQALQSGEMLAHTWWLKNEIETWGKWNNMQNIEML